MFALSILEAEGADQTDATVPSVSEEVWVTVKFSFEIEEVTAAVFCKETAKVSAVHLSHC